MGHNWFCSGWREALGRIFSQASFPIFILRPINLVVLSLLFPLLCGTGAFLYFNEITSGVETKKQNDPFAVLTLLLARALSVSAVIISWQFPGLFHRRILFMDFSTLPLFALLSLLTLGISVAFLKTTNWESFFERLKQTPFFNFVQTNLFGMFGQALP